MPACIAHFQFGQDILNRLGTDLRSLALAFKREFDAGLQGPDIFFFYEPYRSTKIRDYGVERHNEPAVRMFAPILERAPKKAAFSYLMGLICHYALDKCCHPYVYRHSREPYDHHRMESAFDRYVMLKAGLSKARYHYLPAGRLDYNAMATLWPGIEASTIKKCVKTGRRSIWLLDHRKFLAACEAVAGRRGAFTPMTLPDSVSVRQTEHVQDLYALYNKALNECPELIRTVYEPMETKLMDSLFDLNYKGNAPPVN